MSPLHLYPHTCTHTYPYIYTPFTHTHAQLSKYRHRLQRIYTDKDTEKDTQTKTPTYVRAHKRTY